MFTQFRIFRINSTFHDLFFFLYIARFISSQIVKRLCMCVLRKYWSAILCSSYVFLGLIAKLCWPHKISRKCSLLFYFSRDWYYFFFKCLVEMNSQAMLCRLFLCWKTFHYKFESTSHRTVRVMDFF